MKTLALILLSAVAVYAQVSAIVSGSVTDPAGARVSAAAVSAKSVDTGATRGTVTDAEGHYQFFSLPVGQYEIHASKTGFTEEIRTGIHLVVGQSATVDLNLRVGESSQQVTVNGDAPIVAVTTADISGLVGEQQIKNLPLNGRSYDELLTLNPGVVNFTWEKTGGIGVSNSTVGNNFAVAGNRPQQNLFLLNGVEFSGAAENNMQPGGHQPAIVRCRRGARIQRADRFLQRGVWQAAGRAGSDCHAVGKQPAARNDSGISAK